MRKYPGKNNPPFFLSWVLPGYYLCWPFVSSIYNSLGDCMLFAKQMAPTMLRLPNRKIHFPTLDFRVLCWFGDVRSRNPAKQTGYSSSTTSTDGSLQLLCIYDTVTCEFDPPSAQAEFHLSTTYGSGPQETEHLRKQRNAWNVTKLLLCFKFCH